MRLYANPTSPFVRVVRMAIIEKGLADAVEVALVDAWADAPDFLAANPAGRVPALVTDAGLALSEAPLIVRYLDALRPVPALVPQAPEAAAAVLARAGLAFNVFDAAVALIIGRKSAPGFDAGMVGAKRHRTLRAALARLDAALPAEELPAEGLPDGGTQPFDLAAIAAVTALDYNALRFPETDWRGLAPRLAALRDAQADRPSVRETVPRG